jgi:uncharacterized protein
MIDRPSFRFRPPGWPVMMQTWDRLLFLHWPVAEEVIRRLVPEPLTIDTFNGSAWVGITPFTIRGLRPVFLPALPLASSSHEINVRTYVHHNGIPGLWFFSLDASNPLAVSGARFSFALPYYHARMGLEIEDQTITFTSRRIFSKRPAAFAARWELGEPLPAPLPVTLEFFLIERYLLYTMSGRRLYHARIFHDPWPLRQAHLLSLSSSMLEAHGLPTPDREPLLHAQAAPLRVQAWGLTRV